MKNLAFVLPLLALAARPQDPSAQLAPLEPPSMGSIGEQRPEAGAFRTELRRDGTLVVDGKEVDWGEWRKAVRAKAKAHPGKPMTVGGRKIPISKLDVVFVADREMPWGVVLQLMAECAHVDVAAPQIFFGVTDAKTGAPGSFAMFLPADDGTVGGEPVEVAQLRIVNDDVAAHPTRMFAEFEGLVETLGKEARVLVEPQGNIRFSSVLGVADMADRAGIRSFMLGGSMTRAQQAAWEATRDLRAVVRAESAVDGSFRFGPKLMRGGEVEVADGKRQPMAGFASAATAVEAVSGPVEEIEVGAGAGGGRAGGRPARWNNQVGLVGGTGGRYGGRGAGRGSIAEKRPQRAAAIERGLAWLVEHQNDDGSWAPADGGEPISVTSIAILAMLGEGSTLRSGAYKVPIKAGINWLRRQQQDNGEFGNASDETVLTHAVATLAMVEAYTLSQYKLLAKYSRRAVARLQALRNADGGWGRPGSTTVDTAWASLALAAANDRDLAPPAELVAGVRAWLRARRDDRSGRFANGASKVLPRRDAAQAAAFPAEHGELPTAAAMVATLFLGGGDGDSGEALASSVALLAARPPVWNEAVGTVDGVYWLFASDALRQLDEDAFASWSDTIDRVVLSEQCEGDDAGSWEPVSAWGDRGGRAWTTAIMVLNLQAPYRFRPVR